MVKTITKKIIDEEKKNSICQDINNLSHNLSYSNSYLNNITSLHSLKSNYFDYTTSPNNYHICKLSKRNYKNPNY